MASESNPVGPALDVPLAQAIGDFDACQYGEEYTQLSHGNVVELMWAPGGEVADAQWSYRRAAPVILCNPGHLETPSSSDEALGSSDATLVI